MAVTLGDAILWLRADDKKLESGLKSAESKTKSWLGGMDGMMRNAFSFAVGGLIERGIAGIAGGLAGGISAGLGFNNSMEQVTAQLNAFTKDGAKSAEILKMIQERAAKTPFEFEQMATATAALLPSAKQSGAALEDLIGQAEILAASNPAQGLEGAAFALKEAVSGDFTSIIERFNLPRKFINDLKNQGVPALEIVRQAMTNLGLDADLVSNMAETAQGRWSTFKDTITTLAATVMRPIFDTFSSKLGEINTYLAANEPLITAFAQQLAGGVQQAIGWIITTGLPALQQFGDWFMTVGWPAIQPFVVLIISQLIPGLQQLGMWAMQIGQAVLPVLGQAFSVLANNANIVLPILGALGAVILAITSPVTALIGAIVLLGTAWANNWLNIQGITAGVMAVLQPYFDQLALLFDRFTTYLLPLLQQAWQTLIQVWQAEVGPALAQLWASLQQLFTELGLGTGQTDLWQIALGALKLILVGVLVVVQALTPIIRLAAEVMVFMIDQVKTSIDNFIAFKRGIEGVIEIVGRLIEKIRNMASELADLVIPDWLTPGSPTPFEMGLRGIASAIDGMPDFPGLTTAAGGGGAGAPAGGGSGPATVGNISIVINGAGDPAAVGQEVQRQLASLFNQSATQAF